MAPQKIGTEPFTINRIIKIMGKAASYSDFQNNWTNLARELDVAGLIDELNRDHKMLDKINFEDLLSKLLEKWISKAGNEATIDNFYEALKECKFTGILETLQEEFKVVKVSESDAPVVEQSLQPHLRITFRDGSNAIIVLNEVEQKLRDYASPATGEVVNRIILKARSCLQLDDSVNALLSQQEKPKEKVSGLFEIIRAKQRLEMTKDEVIKEFLLMLISDDNETIAKSMENLMTSKGAIINRI